MSAAEMDVNGVMAGLNDFLLNTDISKDEKMARVSTILDRMSEFTWKSAFKVPKEDMPIWEIFCEVLKSNSSICKLDLTDLDLGDEGIVVLAEALEVNTSATKLILAGCHISEKGGHALVDMLKKTSSLCTLILSGNCMGADVTSSLFDALSGHRSLRKLAIPTFEGDSCMEALAGYIEGATSLQNLSLGSGQGASTSASILIDGMIKNSSLRKLSLEFLSMQASHHMARYLETTATLKTLVMGYCLPTEDWIAPIADAMKKNPTLTTLSMDTCNVGDMGIAHISDVLASAHASLETLHLKKCGIGDEGIQQLAHALKTNKTLQVLSITDCNVTEKGAADMADMIKENRTLSGLDMSGTKIKDAGVASLSEALKHNTSLRVVALNDCCIGKDGAEALAGMISQNATLKILDLSNSYTIGTDGREHIEKSMEENYTITQLGVNTPKLHGIIERNKAIAQGRNVKAARSS